MILKNLNDITGDGGTHPITTLGLKSKIVQVYADPANSAPIRIGGSTVDSGNGMPILAGSSQFLPTISDPFEFWQMNLVFYYAENADKLYVMYATEGSNS